MRALTFIILMVFTTCISHTKVVEVFYEDSTTHSKGRVLNSKESSIILRLGLWEEFYPNGQLKSHGEYQKDSYLLNCPAGALQYYNYKIGHWTYYYPHGQVRAKGKYNIVKIKRSGKVCNFGIVDSTWEFYDHDGKIIEPSEELISELEMVAFDYNIKNPQLFYSYNRAKQDFEMMFVQ